jgi:hypothetical protein
MGDALFGTTGDLAIARKLDNTITIEPIPEGTSLTDSVRAQVTN